MWYPVCERASASEMEDGKSRLFLQGFLKKMVSLTLWLSAQNTASVHIFFLLGRSPRKIARMTFTVKLDGNWSSFQLANSASPLSVTDSAIAPSARMHLKLSSRATLNCTDSSVVFRELLLTPEEQATTQTTGSLL